MSHHYEPPSFCSLLSLLLISVNGCWGSQASVTTSQSLQLSAAATPRERDGPQRYDAAPHGAGDEDLRGSGAGDEFPAAAGDADPAGSGAVAQQNNGRKCS